MNSIRPEVWSEIRTGFEKEGGFTNKKKHCKLLSESLGFSNQYYYNRLSSTSVDLDVLPYIIVSGREIADRPVTVSNRVTDICCTFLRGFGSQDVSMESRVLQNSYLVNDPESISVQLYALNRALPIDVGSIIHYLVTKTKFERIFFSVNVHGFITYSYCVFREELCRVTPTIVSSAGSDLPPMDLAASLYAWDDDDKRRTVILRSGSGKLHVFKLTRNLPSVMVRPSVWTSEPGVLGGVAGSWCVMTQVDLVFSIFLTDHQLQTGVFMDWCSLLVTHLMHGKYVLTPVSHDYAPPPGVSMRQADVTAIETCHQHSNWDCEVSHTQEHFIERSCGKISYNDLVGSDEYRDAYTWTPWLSKKQIANPSLHHTDFPCGVCPISSGGKMLKLFSQRTRSIRQFNYGIMVTSATVECIYGRSLMITRPSYGVSYLKYQSYELLNVLFSRLPSLPTFCSCTYGEPCDSCFNSPYKVVSAIEGPRVSLSKCSLTYHMMYTVDDVVYLVPRVGARHQAEVIASLPSVAAVSVEKALFKTTIKREVLLILSEVLVKFKIEYGDFFNDDDPCLVWRDKVISSSEHVFFSVLWSIFKSPERDYLTNLYRALQIALVGVVPVKPVDMSSVGSELSYYLGCYMETYYKFKFPGVGAFTLLDMLDWVDIT